MENKFDYKNNSLVPNELPQRNYFPIYLPKFGNFFHYIELPDFIENQLVSEPFVENKLDENTNKFKIPCQISKQRRKMKEIVNDKTNNPENYFENYSDVEFYVNGIIDKIVYCKFQITAKTICLNNLINVKKESNIETIKIQNDEKLPDNTFGISKVRDINQIEFESRFESGNLHSAFLVGENSYQLVLQNDSNTNGYTQWFFFRMRNKKYNKSVKLNIINMSQKFSLFNEGMRISIYSEQRAKIEKIGWYRGGNDILFYRNGMYKFIGETRKNYSSLTFNFDFKYVDDEVYIAMNIPYTYSKLNNLLNYYSKNEKKYK